MDLLSWVTLLVYGYTKGFWMIMIHPPSSIPVMCTSIKSKPSPAKSNSKSPRVKQNETVYTTNTSTQKNKKNPGSHCYGCPKKGDGSNGSCVHRNAGAICAKVLSFANVSIWQVYSRD